MIEHLTEQKIMQILQEVRKLADNNHALTAQEIVKEIEAMLLCKKHETEKYVLLNT